VKADDSQDERRGVPALSIVIPLYNEAESIAGLLHEIEIALGDAPDYEVIVIDDGSTDAGVDTLIACRARSSLRLRILRHRRNLGQSAALRSGVMAARAAWIATLDGDGQNDPADIPGLLALVGGPAADPMLKLVCGIRQWRRDSVLKRIASRVANAVRGRILDDDTPDTGCGLKLIERATFLALPAFDHMHRFLPALVQRHGGRTLSVPVNHRSRRAGRTKYGIHDRLWSGIADLAGVWWLGRRQFRNEFDEV
jgi:dolichol-phosphate mannosyltransferase